MKYAFLTADGVGLPLAFHLQNEGFEVYLGQVNRLEKLKIKKPEKPEDRQRRLALYNGLLENKWDADRLLDHLLKQSPTRRDDWFVISDFNTLWPYADKLRKAGFKGLLPTQEDYSLEQDRRKAKQLVAERYGILSIGVSEEFKTIEEGKKYLDENRDALFVLKGYGYDSHTVVPEGNDPEVNHLMLEDALTRFKKEFESEGYLLEQKVDDLIEFTPQGEAFDGELLSVSVNIEHKTLGSRSGPLVGCNMGIVLGEDLAGPIYEEFLEPIADMMLRPNELTVWDLSVYWSPSQAKFFPGEYCFNRFGYDSSFAEFDMVGGASEYFNRVIAKQPLFDDAARFGVSVRKFIIGDKDKEELLIGDIGDPNVWVYNVERKDGNNYVSGADKDALVISASADKIEDAIDQLYENTRKIRFDSELFLQKHDFFDKSDNENILHRLDVLTRLEI